jgi:hypothetical protein
MPAGGLVVRLIAAGSAAPSRDHGSRGARHFTVIAAEDDDVAHEGQVGSADLADARAAALLDAIAGGKILLLGRLDVDGAAAALCDTGLEILSSRRRLVIFESK